MKELTCCLFLLIQIGLGGSLKAQHNPPYGNNPDAGKYIHINGVKHYYEVYGSGTPLLLIHGNSTATPGWAPQIGYFQKQYKVYSIDCRGRGKSELGSDSLTYIQQAKDMAAFIQLMNMDSVFVIGKSDGGIIALMLGIYYPQRIKKIVSFGANIFPDSTALFPETVDEIHRERVHAEKKLSAKDTTENWYLKAQRFRLMEFQPHLTAEDLKIITIPVLVMTCDRDVIKEEHSFFIYKHIPLANFALLNGETHHLARQNPDLFNSTIERFLSKPFRTNAYRFQN